MQGVQLAGLLMSLAGAPMATEPDSNAPTDLSEPTDLSAAEPPFQDQERPDGVSHCRALCWAISGLSCTAVAGVCGTTTTITIGGTAVPCIWAAAVACGASIYGSSICSDLCSN